MKAIGKRLTQYLGYALFFAGCFLLFSYWTFPWNRVRDYAITQLEPQVPGYRFRVGSLSPSWVTGMTMTDVKITKTGPTPDQSMELSVDELTLRVKVLPYLFGTRRFTFSAEMGEGELDGAYGESTSGDKGKEVITKEVELELDQVDLARLEVLRSVLTLPLKGKASGEVDLTLSTDTEKTEGVIDLQIDGLVLGDGETKLPFPGLGDGLTIDPIRMGTVKLQADVEKGVAKIKDLSSKGPDAELKIAGEVQLNAKFERSRPDLLARLKFTDAYKNKSDRTK
ncbi:MAG: type II secretion system protein GspN, partial [Myxococcales bacterium]|nr:type II secretion system protein GspN [Myxococcales bacterium]